MRNWPATLLPASFKGFPFRTDQESIDGAGRRVVTHEYVRAEAHDTEDMGRKARSFSVRAYLASDAADVETAAFLEILSTPGIGTLVLPVLGSHLARCTEVRSSSEKTKLGLVAFDLKFVEAATGFAAPILSLGDRISTGAAGAVGALILATLATPVPGSTVAARPLLARAQDVATIASAIVETLPSRALIAPGNNRPDLDMRPVRSAIGRSGTISELSVALTPMVEAIHEFATAASPDEMQTAGVDVSAELLAAIPATSSPGIIAERRVGARLAGGLALMMIAESAAAGASRSFSARTAANVARASIVAAFDRTLAGAGDADESVALKAREAVAAAIVHLDQTAGDLAPLIRVDLAKTTPSTAIAWALYRDPSRAPELVASAGTGTSLFMPTSFIAASR